MAVENMSQAHRTVPTPRNVESKEPSASQQSKAPRTAQKPVDSSTPAEQFLKKSSDAKHVEELEMFRQSLNAGAAKLAQELERLSRASRKDRSRSSRRKKM